jgi:hypothetical protein
MTSRVDPRPAAPGGPRGRAMAAHAEDRDDDDDGASAAGGPSDWPERDRAGVLAHELAAARAELEEARGNAARLGDALAAARAAAVAKDEVIEGLRAALRAATAGSGAAAAAGGGGGAASSGGGGGAGMGVRSADSELPSEPLPPAPSGTQVVRRAALTMRPGWDGWDGVAGDDAAAPVLLCYAGVAGEAAAAHAACVELAEAGVAVVPRGLHAAATGGAERDVLVTMRVEYTLADVSAHARGWSWAGARVCCCIAVSLRVWLPYCPEACKLRDCVLVASFCVRRVLPHAAHLSECDCVRRGVLGGGAMIDCLCFLCCVCMCVCVCVCVCVCACVRV